MRSLPLRFVDIRLIDIRSIDICFNGLSPRFLIFKSMTRILQNYSGKNVPIRYIWASGLRSGLTTPKRRMLFLEMKFSQVGDIPWPGQRLSLHGL